MATDLIVSECFGPTVQGEGPLAGRRCGFVRLGLCNLSCGFCDTPYTWDWQGANGRRYDKADELVHLPVGTVARLVLDMAVNLCVITGGEPMVQRKGVQALVGTLSDQGVASQVETNGTIAPFAHPFAAPGVVWSVSPKLANAGMDADTRLKAGPLAAFVDAGAYFKFVATGPDDLDEVASVVERFGLPPERVWIMPEGIDADTVTERLRSLADPVVARGWNLTGRMHVTIWGNERGR